mmetsp:Transcript_89922/g.160010  ORF Transcript_89922/g.160010 Transcript_89922/m.160010 type:complete len:400 (+) Transcript_89922:37-1236(+)
MMRVGLLHAQGHDRDVMGCNCNELPCGRIYGVPIKLSIYLVIFALYSLAGVAGMNAPAWCIILLGLGGFLILILTILVHEFGHGMTAKHLGGEIIHILLWPLGGLCVHTMPEIRTANEKLWNDWWVTFNGPLTHVLMVPVWVVLIALLFAAYGLSYSAADFWSDLNPCAAGSLSRHPNVVEKGWGAVLLLQLCSTAISVNAILFLFNVLFPLYPMDCSKLLCTGMQLCGTPVQRAARRFIWISAASVLLLLAVMAWNIYQAIATAKEEDIKHMLQSSGLGLLPVHLSVLTGLGLAVWGGKQTYEMKKLSDEKRLHTHPLFSHVPHSTRNVRDIANGRPDLLVEKTVDMYEGEAVEDAIAVPRAQNYGAVRMVGGQIIRERMPQPQGNGDALPRQEIVVQ